MGKRRTIYGANNVVKNVVNNTVNIMVNPVVNPEKMKIINSKIYERELGCCSVTACLPSVLFRHK